MCIKNFFLFLLLLSVFKVQSQTLIPFGATWKYLDNGSDQGTEWRNTTFNDDTWKSGPAALGYGDGDEATVVSYGPNNDEKYITTYFRKNISITDASQYKDFVMKLVRDDGAVVYINGIEVFRSNLPEGSITYTTKANESTTGGGYPPVSVTLPASAFVSGTNEMAVEVHQSSVSSSDLSFDLELLGNPLPNSVQYNLAITTVGSGRVIKNPDQSIYVSGSTVSLTATPDSGFAFSGWSGDTAGTNNPITVTMTGNKTITANFSALISQPQITGFVLVNSSTEQDIQNITDGAVISLSALPSTNLNIRANTSKDSIGSVKFELSGTQNHTYTDNAAPYALFGDDGNGNYYFGNWDPPALGTYTLKATPYSGSKGTGTAGLPLSIYFTIVQLDETPTDQTPPSVVSINRQSPTTESTSSTSVKFHTTFSESVTGVDADDFTLRGSASGTIAAVSGSSATYDVTVNNISGTGTLALDLKSSGTGIEDAAGNDISGGFTSGQTYTITTAQPVDFDVTRGPYLQVGSQTAMTLRWRSDVATDSRIDVGTTLGNYTLSEVNATVTREHEVRISGLTPGTKYYYRFGSSSEVLEGGSDYYFHTAPSPSSTDKVRVAAFGDCGRVGSVQTNVLNAYLNIVGSNPAELLLLLGDNAYVDGTDAEYQSEFFTPYSSTVLKNHVLFPTPGNHDYHTTTRTARDAPYYKNFTLPTAAESGGIASGTEAYYSFNWGNIHFISLDSYGEENPDNTRLYDTLGPQVTWVKKDLAANNSKWTIVYWHHPPFSMGSHNSDTEGYLTRIRENFLRILERYGVDLVLCGHSHNYERSYLLSGYYDTESNFDPDVHAVSTSSGKYNGSSNSCPYTTPDGKIQHGTVYVVSGSAARSGSTIQDGYPHNALPFATNDGGMFYFEVEGNRLDAKMIHANGEVFDQFTILKDVNKTTNVSTLAGAQVTLTASWKGSYKWSTGATTRSITVGPTSNTTYTVTDAANCLKDVFEVNMIDVLTKSIRAAAQEKATSFTESK